MTIPHEVALDNRDDNAPDPRQCGLVYLHVSHTWTDRRGLHRCDGGPTVYPPTIDELIISHRQVGGTHYSDMPMSPFAIIDAFGLDFYRGNALKYLLRAGRKPGAAEKEDLKKGLHYLQEAIDRTEGAEDA